MPQCWCQCPKAEAASSLAAPSGSVSGVEAEVCADIAARQRRGVQKYGVTVEANPLSLEQWLQHAYEECLDQAVYLKKAISVTKTQNKQLSEPDINMPTDNRTADAPLGSLTPLTRQPRHKWFSTYDRDCEDGWWGPYDTVEDAARECVCQNGRENRIFIAQGHKLTKAERYGEFDWEVDAENAFEIILPNEKGQP